MEFLEFCFRDFYQKWNLEKFYCEYLDFAVNDFIVLSLKSVDGMCLSERQFDWYATDIWLSLNFVKIGKEIVWKYRVHLNRVHKKLSARKQDQKDNIFFISTHMINTCCSKFIMNVNHSYLRCVYMHTLIVTITRVIKKWKFLAATFCYLARKWQKG